MNLKEFKNFLEEKLNKEKFYEMAENQIIESAKEVEKAKIPNKSQMKSLIDNDWNNLISAQYNSIKSSIKKNKINNYDAWVEKIDEVELIEQLNDSFNN